MHRVSSLALPVALLLSSLAGCADAGDVVVEVLPPRTSVTCAAPTKTDPALGRGLLDVFITEAFHGGYVADLRLSKKGGDARVTGLTLDYAFSDDNGDVEDAIKDVKGDVSVGDVVLAGADDDLRVAVLENVPLVPRDLAVALHDGNVADKIDFASLDITLTATVDGEGAAAPSTFTVDVCDGCLVTPPDVCSGDGQFAANPLVCRPGQDVPSFTCASGG